MLIASPMGTNDLFLGKCTRRLCHGAGVIPEPGLTPGRNYSLLHQACTDRVNSRVAQKGNL